jgi:hypothetical protein
MFNIFVVDKLPVINAVVSDCYQKLKTDDEYIGKILDKVYGTDPDKNKLKKI